MTLPSELIASLRGLPGFDEEAFLAVHAQGDPPVSIRLNPAKGFSCEGLPVPWCATGHYLSTRPSFITDPAWHAGRYYVQEASSMFVEQAFLQHAPGATRVLDACAAPGGKSTHLQALMGPGSLLVSNEVIRTRVGILSENLQRWGGSNTVVTSADPREFSGLNGFFDLVLVDAPCSGSGLFRREPEAIKEWSPEQVELCGARQQRILSDLSGTLMDGGLLIYSTCAYSPREDEKMVDWLVDAQGFEALPLVLHPSWGVVESGKYGYRFYPHRLEGEGLFLACLRKRGGVSTAYRGSFRAGVGLLGKKDKELVSPWVASPDAYTYLLTGETVRALPSALATDIAHVSSVLPVREAGVAVGQLMRKELVPDPALALSSLLSPGVARVALDDAQALAYLRKDELRLEGAPRGWALVTHDGSGIGWVKVLEGRVNNYYPKQWRVLKR
jgi:16S rRNA C967 or C1407 C5-methylase (RsmB/RsmF family)/NOL1/NOP2/fmu family ribosome biogenesis protein